jgi:hypothetical protein
MSLDEALSQPTEPPEPGLETRHPAGVPLVIITKKMEKAMEGQYPKLGLQRMTSLPRLPPGQAGGNHDVAEVTAFAGGK